MEEQFFKDFTFTAYLTSQIEWMQYKVRFKNQSTVWCCIHKVLFASEHVYTIKKFLEWLIIKWRRIKWINLISQILFDVSAAIQCWRKSIVDAFTDYIFFILYSFAIALYVLKSVFAIWIFIEEEENEVENKEKQRKNDKKKQK